MSNPFPMSYRFRLACLPALPSFAIVLVHDHQTMDVLHGGAGGVDEPPVAGGDRVSTDVGCAWCPGQAFFRYRGGESNGPVNPMPRGRLVSARERPRGPAGRDGG